jgi:hypothetical protein
LKLNLDKLSTVIIILAIATVLAFVYKSETQTSEERRQSFENTLLQTLNLNEKVIVHNQGIIIHNQRQFADHGMGQPEKNITTPHIRTDFWANFSDS